jgi:hypothetical protein
MGFSLELWPAAEKAKPTAASWRGRVLHHASGNVSYFQDWTGLIAVIQELLGLSEAEDRGEEEGTGRRLARDRPLQG